MQDLKTILQIVGGVAAILFLVATAMSYRTWRWHTLVMAPLVLIAAGFFLAYSVLLLRTHQQWREHHRQLVAELAEAKRKGHDLEYGVIADRKLVADGIRQLRQKEIDLTLDRSRMWTGCQPGKPDLATGEVTVTVYEPTPHQIKKGMNLFVFDGREPAAGGAYLGEYRVTAVTGGEMAGGEEPMAEAPAADAMDKDKKAGDKKDADKKDGDKKDADKKDAKSGDKDKKEPEKKEPAPAPPAAPVAGGAKATSTITLVPAWRILPWEQTRTKNSQGPWTLYDKMPVDNHLLFVDIDKDPVTGKQLLDKATNLPVDRVAQLKALAVTGMAPVVASPEYVKDFQPAGPDDPVDRTTVKVEFLKDQIVGEASAPAVGVGAAAAAAPAAPGKPAASTAILYPKGSVAWVARNTVTDSKGVEILGADELIKRGIAKAVPGEKPRFERELRDYAYLFRSLYVERQRMAERAAKIKQQIEDQDGVYTENTALVKAAEAEDAQLKFDLEHYKFELATVDAHLEAVKRQYVSVWDRLRTAFRANQQLAAQLEDLQRRAAATIDRRAPAPPTASVVPPAGPVPAGS
ncbi:MAG: hypothetical protein K8T25_03995 [Planctomycetia bacterium]|nr:hypothetical protein [Planctomycetia bacterium]